MEGQSNLPASAIFLKSFSLKSSICHCAIFGDSVFQTLSSAIPMPTSRKSMSLVLPFYVLFIFGCAGSSLLLGLSLVTASGGYSPVVVCWLLVAVAPLVAEHRL